MQRAVNFFRNIKNSQNWSNSNLTAKMPRTPVIAYHTQNTSLTKLILSKIFREFNMYEKNIKNLEEGNEQQVTEELKQVPSDNNDMFKQIRNMIIDSDKGLLLEEFPRDIESAEKYENEMEGLNLFINFTVNDSGKYLIFKKHNNEFAFYNNDEDLPGNLFNYILIYILYYLNMNNLYSAKMIILKILKNIFFCFKYLLT